jgi:hypothetical protein
VDKRATQWVKWRTNNNNNEVLKMKTLYYSMRVAKLKRHKLTKAHNHNSRVIVEHEKHVHHELTKNNQSLIETNGKTLNQLVNDRMEKLSIKSVRKDAVVAIEMVISATPDYFRPNDPERKTHYEKDKMEAWRDAVLESLKTEFGDNLISAELHLDETTPHIHCCITPIEKTKKKHRQSKQQKARGEEPSYYNSNSFNARKMFTPDYLKYLQDHLPKAVKNLGIERGVKGSKSENVSTKDYHANIAAAYDAQGKVKKPNFKNLVKHLKGEIGKVNMFNFKAKFEQTFKAAYDYMLDYYSPKLNTLNAENTELKATIVVADIHKKQAVDRVNFYDEMVSPYADKPEEFIESFSYQIKQNQVLNENNLKLIEMNDDTQKRTNQALAASSHDYQSLNQELMQTKIDHKKVERSLRKEIDNLKAPLRLYDTDSSSSFDM